MDLVVPSSEGLTFDEGDEVVRERLLRRLGEELVSRPLCGCRGALCKCGDEPAASLFELNF